VARDRRFFIFGPSLKANAVQRKTDPQSKTNAQGSIINHKETLSRTERQNKNENIELSRSLDLDVVDYFSQVLLKFGISHRAIGHSSVSAKCGRGNQLLVEMVPCLLEFVAMRALRLGAADTRSATHILVTGN